MAKKKTPVESAQDDAKPMAFEIRQDDVAVFVRWVESFSEPGGPDAGIGADLAKRWKKYAPKFFASK